jgi:hypothetical protein
VPRLTLPSLRHPARICVGRRSEDDDARSDFVAALYPDTAPQGSPGETITGIDESTGELTPTRRTEHPPRRVDACGDLVEVDDLAAPRLCAADALCEEFHDLIDRALVVDSDASGGPALAQVNLDERLQAHGHVAVEASEAAADR